MNERNKILILGAGEMQVPIIETAKQLGLYTIVVDMAADAPGMAIADEPILISTMDKEAIYSYCITHPVDGICTTSDAPVNVVAYVARRLNLPAMTEQTAKLCTNKYLQRQCFAEHGVKTPFFRQIQSYKDCEELQDFPYIVKPVDSSASRGVQKVYNRNELKTAVENAIENSRTQTAIIESFIEGQEFSVESYTQNGITTIVNITEKQTVGEQEGYFVEDTHIEPARINNKIWHLIESEVQLAIQALGMNNCPGHTEVKVNDNGAFIIESACRLGGDYITSDLVPLSTGVNMLENLLRLSLGYPINVEHKYNKVSAVQFLNTSNYQRCIDFIATNHKAIQRSMVHPYVNTQIRSSLDRLGYIILQTDTMEEMNKILTIIK